MEVTALCFRLLMLEIIQLGTQVQESDAAFLRITPNRLQHFQFDSVSLDCVGFNDSTQLRVIKNTEGFTPACVIKRTSTGSFCTLDRAYPEESGEYWCETDGGERSNSVNITVAAGSVILESPVRPVMEGDDVTLRCRNKANSANLRADFYKDGVLMKSTAAAEMTINNVSMSDKGLYKCTSDVGTSPESWLAVRAGSVILESPVLPVMEGDDVTLRCRNKANSTNLRADFYKDGVLMKSTAAGEMTINSVSMSDEGLYKCTSDVGTSPESWLAVRAGSVILESPVHPVMEGDDVTLRCRNKTNSTNLRADFYKDGVFMKSTAAGEMTINSVSMSDEGLYKCTSDVGTSPESWLAVRAKSVSVTSQTPHEGNHTVVHHSSIPTRLHLWVAIIIVTVSLVLLVVGFLCIWRRKGTAVFCFSSKTSSGSSEHNQIDDTADDRSCVMYTVMTIKQRQDKASDTAGAADSLSRDTNHRRKPQTQKDEDESSRQPVYSALKLDKTPQALQTGLYVCKIFKIPKFIYFSTTTDISTLCLHLIRPICDYKGPHIHFHCGLFDPKVTLTVSYDSNDHLQLIQNIFSIVKDILKPRTYCTK
ncbi:Fc receptor-like protein 5 isoform X2 [Thunnus thynnus]|uniref:Fc receptor-like protein 5 isoform X2 n=1 Tax=Thunnus thynnus TaxID=8237 RepID=UPI003528996C